MENNKADQSFEGFNEKMKNSELHLFIIWNNALYKKEEILADIRENFLIRNIFSVEWSESKWENNISRFYGTSLPDAKAKIKECGSKCFLAVIVETDGTYQDYRETSKGNAYVNTLMFDKKNQYREMTGGGHKIHSTNTVTETDHDFTLLFGVNSEDFIKKYKKNEKEVIFREDTFCLSGFPSLNDFLYTLNNCINYVVLRDFENDLHELIENEDYDLDILCDNAENASLTLAAKESRGHSDTLYCVSISNKKVFIDIKQIDDGYYCEKLARDILENRVMYKNSFYIPDESRLYKSHLLHALIHKNNYENEYNDRLAFLYKEHDRKESKNRKIESLSKWMIENDYYISVYSKNPEKLNVDNVRLFDKKCFNPRIVEEIKIRQTIKKLEQENESLKKQLEIITNTKGYKLIEAIRKPIIWLRRIVK